MPSVIIAPLDNVPAASSSSDLHGSALLAIIIIATVFTLTIIGTSLHLYIKYYRHKEKALELDTKRRKSLLARSGYNVTTLAQQGDIRPSVVLLVT